jgi:dTDP-4-dehydrorhamnose reductase
MRSFSEPMEIWAGLECTLNRVGDVRHDQLALLGHYDRPEDIERLADLGVRVVRYPILWERYVDEDMSSPLWRALDDRMMRLMARGVEPIVGLLHHGSGPNGTSLVDTGFAEGLAAFARKVSRRYPWVTRYTPINEPLTTARFSALYGAWYPHARDDVQFLRATLNQVRAVRMAMDAIRTITPNAELLQTEDLGRTHSTPALAYQAAFENERRWLTFDLLLNRVGPGHAMHDYGRWLGITEGELAHAVGDGCAPALLGINHYVTSERWLDERVDRYPAHTHGGNRRHQYADVEAVRAMPEGAAGPAALLLEASARYALPIVVSEAHLGCTREQHLRWLHEVWMGAHLARANGADVRAVTAWAAFGVRDWDSLVTRLDGRYEAGLFDIRAPVPRPTAVHSMVQSLATSGSFDHPVLDSPGWWRCTPRLTYMPNDTGADTIPDGARPLLIVGASGTLGHAFVQACKARGLACVAASRKELDISNETVVSQRIASSRAWAVINTAGFVRVDDAERDPVACERANTHGAGTLAEACANAGVSLLTFSSDLVFNGLKRTPYVETDQVSPLGEYGASKARAESLILSLLPSALVIRTSSFFGPWDASNFLTQTLSSLENGVPVHAACDLVMSPTYVPDLADAALDLLIDGACGLWHLANDGAVTWADFALCAAARSGLDQSLIIPRPHRAFGYAAARPPYSVLGSERAWLMPSLDDALRRFLALRTSHTQKHAACSA